MKVKDRSGKEKEIEESKLLKFLYHNFLGRIILKIMCTKFVANMVGFILNRRISYFLAKKKIKEYQIDMDNYEISKKSYNGFFTRKSKNLNIDYMTNHFISPADSKLIISKISEDSIFEIKGSKYRINEIIEDEIINDYINGYALIFRLDVNDYHRYIYVDNGKRDDYRYIKGMLHTVQPIAYSLNVFHRNTREWCILKTENYDNIIQVEVGAMNVGKIVNEKNKSFNKGDEKGHFEFGGSTIILFVKDNIVNFDEDILENSKKGIETIVKCGSKIGIKKLRKINLL